MDKTGIAITYIENVIIIWYYIQMNPPDKSFPELIDGEDMGPRAEGVKAAAGKLHRSETFIAMRIYNRLAPLGAASKSVDLADQRSN